MKAGWHRGALVAGLAAGLATSLATVALSAQAPEGDGGEASALAPTPPPTPPPTLRFEEVGAQAGARFVHSTRRFTGRHKAQVLEMFTDGGAAVAVGDFDNDGRDDLFLTDSDEGKPCVLLRNAGSFTFTDVTAAAGVAGGNSAEAIVADALWLDFDNDGWRDLLLARFGTPILYRNQGLPAGADAAAVPRFVDVSASVGLTAFGNTIAVIAFDADGDGWLDLLLGNYFRPVNLLALGEERSVLPNDLDRAVNGGGVTFWRNVAAAGSAGAATGGRRFVEATAEAGFAHHTGWSLDLGHGDLDNDGDQDVYIAGDYGTDRLFLNRGDGTFEDVTEERLGFDTRKGMNVDMGDYDRNGWLDIFVTNITDEYMKECNMLWTNHGDGTFLDLSRETGTCDSDWGWAGHFADFDNDGWEDIYTVNGLRSRGEENYIPLLLEAILTPDLDFSSLDSYPDIGERTWSGYQRQRFFHNLGDGTFREEAQAVGLGNDLDGRGLGVADFDGDGRLDIVQTNANQPSLLFRNAGEHLGHWLELDLVGTASNRDAIGARVIVEAGGARLLREVDGGNGYAGQSSRRVHFGLGAAERIDAVEVRWPSGAVERWRAPTGGSALPVDALSTLTEGQRRGEETPTSTGEQAANGSAETR